MSVEYYAVATWRCDLCGTFDPGIYWATVGGSDLDGAEYEPELAPPPTWRKLDSPFESECKVDACEACAADPKWDFYQAEQAANKILYERAEARRAALRQTTNPHWQGGAR